MVGACVVMLGAAAKGARTASDLPEAVRARLAAIAVGATLVGSALGLVGVFGALVAV